LILLLMYDKVKADCVKRKFIAQLLNMEREMKSYWKFRSMY